MSCKHYPSWDESCACSFYTSVPFWRSKIEKIKCPGKNLLKFVADLHTLPINRTSSHKCPTDLTGVKPL